jgi:ribonuclease Z
LKAGIAMYRLLFCYLHKKVSLMNQFSVLILGSNSATPTTKRNPSAQLISHNHRLFLADCGEGTQVTLRKLKVHFQSINHIFISHLHGDHFYGLIGLISSMHLLGRLNELHLYGPPELKEVIDLQLKVSQTTLIYPLLFHFTQSDFPEIIYENSKLTISTIPMIHRIPTTGFLFREKPAERKIKKEILEQYHFSFDNLHALKQGEDIITDEGVRIKNENVTLDPPPCRSYAMCSDTAYNEDLIPIIHGADLLYHETTFMQEKADAAKDKQHSTTFDAATIAKKAGVKKLIIGHYSARYDELQPLLEEARSIFPETYLTIEGISINV